MKVLYYCEGAILTTELNQCYYSKFILKNSIKSHKYFPVAYWKCSILYFLRSIEKLFLVISDCSETHICVSGLRPQSEGRLPTTVGLPMITEFVLHHLSLGVSHILIGLQLDWYIRFSIANNLLLLLHNYFETIILAIMVYCFFL